MMGLLSKIKSGVEFLFFLLGFIDRKDTETRQDIAEVKKEIDELKEELKK